MSKLDPRPPKKKVLYSWEELNERLQVVLSQPNNSKATINVDEFEMSAEEIIAEAEKQGYEVEQDDNFLIFT